MRVTGVSWDVSERSRMENALKRERFLLKTLMDNLPDSIYFKDKESRFIAVNRAMAVLFGMEDPGDLLGKTDADLFASEHAQAGPLRDELKILRTGQPLVNIEEKETWPDGMRRGFPLQSCRYEIPTETSSALLVSRATSRRRSEQKENSPRSQKNCAKRTKPLSKIWRWPGNFSRQCCPHRYPRFPYHASKEESAVRFYPLLRTLDERERRLFSKSLKLSDTSVGVFICDVMGHGVRAALVASTVSALVGQLRDYLEIRASCFPARIGNCPTTLEYSEGPIFASAFYLYADLEKGELSYANAGHPNPLRVHYNERDRADTYPLNGSKHGPALGLFDVAIYPNSNCELSPRDTLLLFTDGLFEVEGPGGDIYDYQRLLEAVNRRRELPAFQLCHEVIEEVQQFSAGRRLLTMMCASSQWRLDHRAGNLFKRARCKQGYFPNHTERTKKPMPRKLAAACLPSESLADNSE